MNDPVIKGEIAAGISPAISLEITKILNTVASDYGRHVHGLRCVSNPIVDIEETSEREMLLAVIFNRNDGMPRRTAVEAVLRVSGVGEDQKATALRLCRTPDDSFQPRTPLIA